MYNMINTTVNDIITLAFEMIGEFSRDFDTIPGGDFCRALSLLNTKLALIKIPYSTLITFNTVAGQPKYESGIDFTNISADKSMIQSIEFLNLRFKNTDRPIYPLSEVSSNQVYNNFFNLGSEGRPVNYLLENQPYVSYITFFPTPNQEYEIDMQARFPFVDIKSEMKLSEIKIPYNWNDFLRYALAYELISFYHGSVWSAKNDREYKRLLNYTNKHINKSEGAITDNVLVNNSIYSKNRYSNGCW